MKTCQHTRWLGQCCSGLSGLTNCLVYVSLSASWINVAWLDYGQSVCYPITFSKPGPLNSLLPGQTCRSHVCCSCVTEGWPCQYCFSEAGDICLLVTGLGCIYEQPSTTETLLFAVKPIVDCWILFLEIEGAILPHLEEKKGITAKITIFLSNGKLHYLGLSVFACL